MHITGRHDHVSCDLQNMQFHPHMCCFSSSSTPVVLEPWDSFTFRGNTSVLKHSPHDGGETHNPAFLAYIPLTPSSVCSHPDFSLLRSRRALCFLDQSRQFFIGRPLLRNCVNARFRAWISRIPYLEVINALCLKRLFPTVFGKVEREVSPSLRHLRHPCVLKTAFLFFPSAFSSPVNANCFLVFVSVQTSEAAGPGPGSGPRPVEASSQESLAGALCSCKASGQTPPPWGDLQPLVRRSPGPPDIGFLTLVFRFLRSDLRAFLWVLNMFPDITKIYFTRAT